MAAFAFPFCLAVWGAGRVVASRERVARAARRALRAAASPARGDRRSRGRDRPRTACLRSRSRGALAAAGDRSSSRLPTGATPRPGRARFSRIELLGRESLDQMRMLLGLLRASTAARGRRDPRSSSSTRCSPTRAPADAWSTSRSKASTGPLAAGRRARRLPDAAARARRRRRRPGRARDRPACATCPIGSSSRSAAGSAERHRRGRGPDGRARAGHRCSAGASAPTRRLPAARSCVRGCRRCRCMPELRSLRARALAPYAGLALAAAFVSVGPGRAARPCRTPNTRCARSSWIVALGAPILVARDPSGGRDVRRRR